MIKQTLELLGKQIIVQLPDKKAAIDLANWRVGANSKEVIILNETMKRTTQRDLMFEVGTEIGIYTVFYGKHFRSVVAIEPDKIYQRSLARNAELNHINVHIEKAACGNKPGKAFLYTNEKIGNSLCPTLLPEYGEAKSYKAKRNVTIKTIDAIAEVYGYPSFIKIDVEGYDVEVLEGAKETLQKLEALQIELHPEQINKNIVSDCYALLKEANLRQIYTIKRGNELLELWIR